MGRRQRSLITGGAGSLGTELTIQLLKNGAKHVVVVDNSERGLVELDDVLTSHLPGERSKVSLELGNVCDRGSIERILERWSPELVFHFAAIKHVPVGEHNPYTTFKTNVGGTQNILAASLRSHVKRFVLMSTDKAVYPAGFMGATKRMAELLTMYFSERDPNCNYSIIRTGNIVGSSGSVLSKFDHQIRSSNEVSVTDPRMTRYFIDKAEVVRRILRSVVDTVTPRGSVTCYVFDCGDPRKIVDVVRELILRHGKKLVDLPSAPDEIAIRYVGARDGEKLTEQLHHDDEFLTTKNENARIAKNVSFTESFEALDDELRILVASERYNIEEYKRSFRELIQELSDLFRDK